MKQVSVIIPVYNTEKYIRRCLESILGQTLKDIEVLCIDDGSTDGSAAILAEFADRDSRVKVITQKNSGAGASRNAGIAAAIGKYLYFMDSDDWIDADYVERMVSSAERSGSEIVFNANIITHGENRDCKYEHPSMPAVERQGEWMDGIRMAQIAPVFVWARLYRREFIERNGLRFPNLRICQDVAFHYLAHLCISKTWAFEGAAYHYSVRLVGNVGSSKARGEWDLWHIRAYESVFDYLQKHDLLNGVPIKLFNVGPFFAVDSAGKFACCKQFIEKIWATHFCLKRELYNDLDRYFADSIHDCGDYEEYRRRFPVSVPLGYLRAKSRKAML